MKTKLLALLLVIVMLVSMLAACDNTPDPDPDPDPTCTEHVDKNKDKRCDKCNAPIKTDKPDVPGPGGDDDELPGEHWEETSLLFQMTHNSNKQELSSGCEKYLAGESDDVGSIYSNVKDRNRDAEDYANVKVTYTYFPDTTGYGWGQNINRLEELATSGTEKGRPDMFCNFIYDMVSASLRGSFANLYTNELASNGVDDTAKRNYLAFAKDGKYDATYEDTGEGYMIEFMQSLTLSEHKMYLLASDYFIDLVRAFFVVPVNIALLERIQPSDVPGTYNYDADEDGAYEISDFYELVRNYGWNYDAVKAFSADIESGTGTGDVLDGTHGFALACGGLSASGILYTTSIIVINRKVETYTDPDTKLPYQEYTFWYPDQSEPLEEFCDNLSALFGSKGVTAVEGSSWGSTNELAVRERFSNDFVLFGGIICVGSLEEQAYKDMTAVDRAGFGVVPVPLYRSSYIDPETGTEKTDRYLTQIHNIGRVGAIAVKTNKFAQCTAFLDYQALNSTDILNDYYDWTLKGDVAGAVEGNAEMLDYVRENVRSSFDKAFEDAIARHYLASGDSTYNGEKWHNMILAANYQLSRAEIHTKYEQLVEKKGNSLKALEISYTGLP